MKTVETLDVLFYGRNNRRIVHVTKGSLLEHERVINPAYLTILSVALAESAGLTILKRQRYHSFQYEKYRPQQKWGFTIVVRGSSCGFIAFATAEKIYIHEEGIDQESLALAMNAYVRGPGFWLPFTVQAHK